MAKKYDMWVVIERRAGYAKWKPVWLSLANSRDSAIIEWGVAGWLNPDDAKSDWAERDEAGLVRSVPCRIEIDPKYGGDDA